MSDEKPEVVDKRRFRQDGETLVVGIDEPLSPFGPTFSPSSNPNKPTTMDLGTALHLVSEGKRVTRLEWGNPEIYLLMFMWGAINPEVPSGKYLSIHHANGHVHPLYLNDGDLRGGDWIELV